MKLRPKIFILFLFSPKFASLFLSWTSGPVVACFYYQHLYTRFQTPNCSFEQSRSCTLAFLSWVSLVQSEFEVASKDFYTVSSQSSLLFSLTVSVSPSSVFSFPIHQSSVVVSRSSVKFRLYNSTGNCVTRSWWSRVWMNRFQRLGKKATVTLLDWVYSQNKQSLKEQIITQLQKQIL